MELKIIKYNGRYFSNFVNNRRTLYSFSNIHSAQKCCMYIAHFRNRYGVYPYSINNNTPIYKLKLVEPHKRIHIKHSLKELEIEQESSLDLLMSCSSLDMGLVLINNFDYSFLDNEVGINFVGCDLFTKDVLEYNHLEIIN